MQNPWENLLTPAGIRSWRDITIQEIVSPEQISLLEPISRLESIRGLGESQADIDETRAWILSGAIAWWDPDPTQHLIGWDPSPATDRNPHTPSPDQLGLGLVIN